MRISDWSSDVCSSDLARESLFLKDAGDFQNGLRLLLCPLNPGPRSRPQIDIDATRLLHRDAHYGMSVKIEFAGAPLFHRHAPQGRSDARRVGNECVSKCMSWWSPYN